eukprot:scaffold65140_cov76-Attheya_sp.AAC.4
MTSFIDIIVSPTGRNGRNDVPWFIRIGISNIIQNPSNCNPGMRVTLNAVIGIEFGCNDKTTRMNHDPLIIVRPFKIMQRMRTRNNADIDLNFHVSNLFPHAYEERSVSSIRTTCDHAWRPSAHARKLFRYGKPANDHNHNAMGGGLRNERAEDTQTCHHHVCVAERDVLHSTGQKANHTS